MQKLLAEAHRVLPESGMVFSFPPCGVCVVFRKRKAEQTGKTDFYTRAIVRAYAQTAHGARKTTRFARSFCDGIASIFMLTKTRIMATSNDEFFVK